jgi:hypothetical protein
MDREQADTIFKLIESDIAAHKNWIASSVEANQYERAQTLVQNLRHLRDLYRGFNLAAKHDIAAAKQEAMPTEIDIRF